MSSDELALATLIAKPHRIETLQGLTAERIVQELLEAMSGDFGFDQGAIDSMQRAIIAREREATTGLGNYVAIPHMKNCPSVVRVCGALGRSRAGVEWSAPDGAPVHIFFLMLTPAGHETQHVKAMKKIVRLSRDRKTVDFLIQTPSFANLDAIFGEIDAHAD